MRKARFQETSTKAVAHTMNRHSRDLSEDFVNKSLADFPSTVSPYQHIWEIETLFVANRT